MNELENLIAQRRELDAKIRKLKQTGWEHNTAKLTVERNGSNETWYLKVKTLVPYATNIRWYTIAHTRKKEDILQRIKELYGDLKAIADEVEDG